METAIVYQRGALSIPIALLPFGLFIFKTFLIFFFSFALLPFLSPPPPPFPIPGYFGTRSRRRSLFSKPKNVSLPPHPRLLLEALPQALFVCFPFSPFSLLWAAPAAAAAADQSRPLGQMYTKTCKGTRKSNDRNRLEKRGTYKKQAVRQISILTSICLDFIHFDIGIEFS